MARNIEIVDTKEVDHLEDRVAVDEQASDDLLFGGLIEGDLSIGCADLERHETGQFRTNVLVKIECPRRTRYAAEAPRAGENGSFDRATGEGPLSTISSTSSSTSWS